MRDPTTERPTRGEGEGGGSGEEIRRMFLALLVGAGMLLLGLLFYGMATALIMRLLVRWTRAGCSPFEFCGGKLPS